MPKVDSNYIFLAVVLINLVFKKDENNERQLFLKEYKYIEKENGVIRYITDDLEFSSDDF